MALKGSDTHPGAGWTWLLQLPVLWLLGSLALFPFSSPQKNCHGLKHLLWVLRE